MKAFDCIDDVVTIRYESYFRNPEPNWDKQLKGLAGVKTWLKERLGQ